MHFSIPDTQEFVDSTGNPYLAYNIHINGLFHCTVRYKQLLNLHEQLAKDLDVPLPPFPPKKFFPLTASQQEDRRLALERYIQTIGQNTAINNSELVNGFLLNAQQETRGRAIENENFEVFLMNGQSVSVKVSTADNSSSVLKLVCRRLKLREQFDAYFALYVVIVSEDGQINVLRRLQDFESPLMTQRNIGAIGVKVTLAKGYWDISYDLEVMRDPVALNLLYTQTLSEIERGCIPADGALRNRLHEAQNRGGKREFLEVARKLKYYGYLNFVPCYCDYPQHATKVQVAIGKNELNLRFATEGEEEHEAVFKVTRMRCWRITTLHNGTEKSDETSDYSLELSFEYLMARNQLQWITISSDQSILMSVCLQAMIDELLLKNVGGNKTPETSGKSWTYVMRDGHSRLVIGSQSNENISKASKESDDGDSRKAEPVMKKLAERFSAARSRSLSESRASSVVGPDKRRTNDCDITENNAFHMIGDDDL